MQINLEKMRGLCKCSQKNMSTNIGKKVLLLELNLRNSMEKLVINMFKKSKNFKGMLPFDH